MLHILFELVCDFVHFVSDIPIIKGISKRSIMGNFIDKTIEYYISNIQTTPLDDKYTIKYKCKGRDFFLSCKCEDFKAAIKYIKSIPNLEYRDKIFHSAYELTSLGISDITQRVNMFAGPFGDFYKDTGFYITPEDVTESEIFLIVLNNLDTTYPNRYRLIEIV